MSEADQILRAYLRQQAELGGPELYLDTMTPDEFINGLRRRIQEGLDARDGRLTTTDTGHIAQSHEGTKAATGSLASLKEVCSGCTLCRLWESRTQVVFGTGSETAELLVVGEAPGQEEDKTGVPFVGRAGKLLDLLLMSSGFPRQSVYICNVLKCRPPNNRNPLPDEVATCTTNYLFPQLDGISPRAILAVGKFAAQALLESDESIGRLRGVKHTYRGIPLVVTYHPAYLLRSPQMTRVAWDDYQLVRKVLDGEV